MLGRWSLLPFLKGWAYKTHVAYRPSLERGMAPTPIFEIDPILKDELGWVYALQLISDDCYGSVHIKYRSGDLTEKQLETVNAESAVRIGAFSQDPAGWAEKYFRPNPYSTAGYYVVQSTGGFQGSPWPFLPPIRIMLSLRKESTQKTASCLAVAGVMAITEKKLFIQSLRRVLDPKSSLYVDPAVLDIAKKIFEDVKGVRK